MRIRV
ncbi:hypothetical protein LINGRAHAP2_LOCUS23604 [Linum grandiflorum]